MSERLAPQPWMQDPALHRILAALGETGDGAVARLVGGCVRDAVLGLPIRDVDIATVLEPEAVMRALPAAGVRAVPTGLEHGVVTAVTGGRGFEVTTLRRDVATDGRRAVVAFSRDWGEDAQRRDFRMNALYLDLSGAIHDPTGGGLDDARAGRVVFVGDAATRIAEDYLRILRYFRFLAGYGRGEPDASAVAACAAGRAGLAGLSGERVSAELLKLLAAADPRPAVRLMRAAGVLQVLLPEVAALERFEVAAALTRDPLTRLAALLPDDPAVAAAVARRLRLSRAHSDRLAAAAEGPLDPNTTPADARRLLYRLGAEAFCDRVRLGAAAQGGDPEPLLALADDWRRPMLPVGGADGQALGLSGPALGAALKAVEAWWAAGDFQADRAQALARLARSAETGAGD